MKDKIITALIAAVVAFIVAVSGGAITPEGAHKILERTGIEQPVDK